MHPRTMRHLAIGFAGACSLLLACAKNDDTTFPNLPHPTETPTPHPVLDAGLIVFSDADGEGVEGIGAGTYTPDAAEVVDVVVDAAAPDLGGLGSSCDVFAPQNPCPSTLGCFLNPATGIATCQSPGNNTLPLGSQCTPGIDSTCGPQLNCTNGICTNLCHFGQASATECGNGTGSAACSTRVGPAGLGIGACESL
jgi:hypothetical protein